eukprot:6198100-Pleurochrysis_carterae.AAC.1
MTCTCTWNNAINCIRDADGHFDLRNAVSVELVLLTLHDATGDAAGLGYAHARKRSAPLRA